MTQRPKLIPEPTESLQVREEIRRNGNDLVQKISNHTGGYSCVDIRGTGKDGKMSYIQAKQSKVRCLYPKRPYRLSY